MSQNAPQGPAVILHMLQGAQASAVLGAAIELGVFAPLAGTALGADDVAKRIGTPPRSTRILLDALAVLGLVTKEGAKYRLAPVAEDHLVPGKPMYAGDVAGIFGAQTMWAGLARLTDIVRNDGTVLPEHAETPKHPFWETFAKSSGSMAMAASRALDAHLGPWIEKKGKVRVLDVACGSGIYGFALAKHPNVELTSLDWPNVLVTTREWRNKLGVDASRVKYLEGNLFDTDFGGPYDVIITSHIFHHFDAPTCQGLAKKAAGALAPGGRVVVHEFFANDPTNPQANMFSITMLVWTRKGEAFARQDYEAWFKAAGLGKSEFHPNQGMPTGFLFVER